MSIMLSWRSISLLIQLKTKSIYFLTSYVPVSMRFGFSGMFSKEGPALLIIDFVGVETLDSWRAGIFKVSSSESSNSLNFNVRLVFIGSLLVDEVTDYPLGRSSIGDLFMISGVLITFIASCTFSSLDIEDSISFSSLFTSSTFWCSSALFSLVLIMADLFADILHWGICMATFLSPSQKLLLAPTPLLIFPLLWSMMIDFSFIRWSIMSQSIEQPCIKCLWMVCSSDR